MSKKTSIINEPAPPPSGPADAPSRPGNPAMNELPGELATDAANIGMWSLNVDANIFWGNQKVLDIFCLPPGDITLQQFLDRVHPDDHSMINDEIRLALEDGESHSIEYRVCLPDGSRRWINARGSLCKNSDNFSQKLIGVVIDTTERKASEEAGVRMLEFETLLFEISSSFARFIMAADVDRLIEDSLGKLLRYFGGDRSGLVKLDMASRTARITHIFCRDGIPPVPADINLLPMFPWGFDLVLRKDFHFFSPDLAWREQFHCFSSLDELPPEAETDRRTYEATGVKSALRVPIKVEENIFYILAIQSLTRNISWPFEAMPRLRYRWGGIHQRPLQEEGGGRAQGFLCRDNETEKQTGGRGPLSALRSPRHPFP